MNERTPISDERLFIRYAEGEGTAFRDLMDRYADRLVRFCRGYVGSQDEAEDLVQETFLRVIRSAGTYRATDRFSTWVHTIARNLCLDHLKVRGRRDELRMERAEELHEQTLGDPVGSDRPAGAAGLEASFAEGELEAALGGLTDLEAETIRLTFFAEWNTRQIAELQGCAASTVRARRHQALEKMRAVLDRVDRLDPTGGRSGRSGRTEDSDRLAERTERDE